MPILHSARHQACRKFFHDSVTILEKVKLMLTTTFRESWDPKIYFCLNLQKTLQVPEWRKSPENSQKKMVEAGSALFLSQKRGQIRMAVQQHHTVRCAFHMPPGCKPLTSHPTLLSYALWSLPHLRPVAGPFTRAQTNLDIRGHLVPNRRQ